MFQFFYNSFRMLLEWVINEIDIFDINTNIEMIDSAHLVLFCCFFFLWVKFLILFLFCAFLSIVYWDAQSVFPCVDNCLLLWYGAFLFWMKILIMIIKPQKHLHRFVIINNNITWSST